MFATFLTKATAFGLLVVATFTAGCSGPSVHQKLHQSHPSLDADCCPVLYEVKDGAPLGAAVVAEIGYGESGFSKNCSYPENIERIRVLACRLGADAVKIVAENHPNFVSTCYRVRAHLYRLGAGLDSQPELAAIRDADRGKCPGVLTRRFQTPVKK